MISLNIAEVSNDMWIELLHIRYIGLSCIRSFTMFTVCPSKSCHTVAEVAIDEICAITMKTR